MPDPHSVLGLGQDASLADARRAFRRLVLELHPDRHRGDPRGAARLRAVIEAYEAFAPVGPRPRRRRAPRPRSAPPPPPPRTRERYACRRCDDTFAFGGSCPRCQLPLADERASPVEPLPDPRVDAMVARLERRAAEAPRARWARAHIPAIAISSLLAGGALALPVHVPVAIMFVGYALLLTAAELVSPA